MKYLTLAATTLFATQAWADTPELVVYTYDSFVAEWGPGPVIEAAFEAECACDLKFVGMGDGAALRGVFVLAGFALVHPVLDHLFGDRHTGGTAVHRGPQSRPVAFAPGGHAEKMAKAVDRHGRCSFGGDP